MLHVDRCAADQTSLHFRQYLGFLACAGASVPLKPRVERTRMFSAILSRRCCSYAESSAMAAAASPAAASAQDETDRQFLDVHACMCVCLTCE